MAPHQAGSSIPAPDRHSWPSLLRWIGIKIRVTKGKTRFGGKSVDCVEFDLPPGKISAEIDDAIPGWN
jgi:hypothetical protein